ncbi:MAG: S8 family peptidase [Patescibacteria group bacterium]|jgi:subtilisin family serine protease
MRLSKIIPLFLIITFLFPLETSARLLPDDPFYSRQWYLAKVKADEAWTIVSGTPDITVAVIDAGVDINHPDLKGNIWINEREIPDNNLDDDGNGFIDDVYGWDFVNDLPDPSPKFEPGWTEAGVSHGTIIAGIIGARGNNNQGVTGLAWRANIMPLRVLNDRGEGRVSAVVRAIDYAIRNGADIINLSFVTYNYNDSLAAAIERAYEAGIIVVAAAGNDQAAGDGRNTAKNPIYPACMDGSRWKNMVVGVAATDALDQKTLFSGYGEDCIDITAPGISFFSTITPGSNPEAANPYYDGYWSGTSMATAVVSGVMALTAQANPNLSRADVVGLVLGSADSVALLNPDYPGQLGFGRVNAAAAVMAARQLMYDHVNLLLLTPYSGQEEILVASLDGATSTPFQAPAAQGLSAATGDLFGDGKIKVVTANGLGAEPWVRVYDQKGKLLKEFLAYNQNFKGGVRLAVGDYDLDGKAEIITVPGPGGGPHVRVFDGFGQVERQFFADSLFDRGGLSVALGDVDGNNRPELIIGLGEGREPIVKIFNNQTKLEAAFYVYSPDYRGGVNVAAASLYGRQNGQRDSIIVAPAGSYQPQVRIFDNYGRLQQQFLAYNPNWRGGVSLAAGDVSNDGIAEIITGAQSGGAAHARVFDRTGSLVSSFYAYPESFTGGVNVNLIRFNN